MYPYDFVSALGSYKMGRQFFYNYFFYNENTTHTHTQKVFATKHYQLVSINCELQQGQSGKER